MYISNTNGDEVNLIAVCQLLAALWTVLVWVACTHSVRS